MFEKIKNSITYPFQEKKYAIVGVVLGEMPQYNVLIIDKQLDNLSVQESFFTEKFESLIAQIPTSTPILLSFSGKGIISKKVSAGGNYLKEVLFNASVNDFYSYELHQNQHIFISIVRKNSIDYFFHLFSKHKYLVVDYSIGAFVGSVFKRLYEGDSIVSNDYRLIFRENIVEDIQKVGVIDEQYLLGEEKFDNIQITLFSTLLNYLYPSEEIQYIADFLKGNKQEKTFQRIFNNAAIGLGIFFLVSLLSSYLLLNYYNNKYVSYESQLYNLNDTYNQVKKLEKEKENKTKILNESGALDQNFLSFYMYRIVHSIPNKIGLDEIKINPLQKKIKSFEKIEIEANTIIVVGKSNSSTPINSWVKVLKQEKWISKIEILNFSKKRDRNSEFTLKISVK